MGDTVGFGAKRSCRWVKVRRKKNINRRFEVWLVHEDKERVWEIGRIKFEKRELTRTLGNAAKVVGE